MEQDAVPAGIRLGVGRGISYGLFGAPDAFVPQVRALGGTLVRVYVYWGQVEPQPGRYDWTAVDAILEQLDPAAETWFTVCSSSPWATRTPSGFLPSSPANDEGRYALFIDRLVSRCRGRVAYWQCGNEPSNTGLLWDGTAPEYVAQLAAFARAVREADPAARVVLGGCGYDVLSSPPGSPARVFFDQVVEQARDDYDLFCVNLYGDPHDIPVYVDDARTMMRGHGYERPVVAGEYNGPTLFEFPEAQAAFQREMTAAFTAPATGPEAEPPDRRTMRALYDRAAELPDTLRMFLEDCPPELTARRDRINCRQIVTRNILALAAGVSRTVCWNLAPEIPGYRDRLNMMGFLFGKLALLDYDGTELTVRRPSADTFALLAAHLEDVDHVRRVAAEHSPDLFLFEVERHGQGPLEVMWTDGDVFTGEERPASWIERPWPHADAHAVDAFGTPVPVERDGVLVRLRVSVTPVFLSGGPAPVPESGRSLR
ncbi:hypothetical protein OG788_42355 [Streptomyces sp. NBC_00647]|uniref:hypothetical protein n=1 Tax=Streptomyces sp. NBC_00647 TaxID=2975796 RepID=UPI0032512CF6